MRPHLLHLFPFALLPLVACGTAAAPTPAGAAAACDADQGPCTLPWDFGVTALAAGQEIDDQCFSWTLENPTDLWVSAVDLDNDGAYHHSNWFYVPDRSFDHPDGNYRCGEVHFTELGAALLGGVLFAQSTQARKETQRFPEGAVLRVPAWSRVIGSVHLLNAAAGSVETGLRMRLHTRPPAEARVKLSPFRLTYYDLHLPPRSASAFSGTCAVRKAYQELRKEPLRMNFYFTLPHYHELGRRFQLEIAGGPADGQVLVDSRTPIGEPGGRAFDPPVDLGESEGLRFRCTFDNPRDKAVGWGIGDQEMCVMLGFTESPVAFDATVERGAPAGRTPDGAPEQSGPCEMNTFNYFAG